MGAERPDLGAWLARAGFDLDAARPLAGDISPRRYERLVASDGRSAILALYPPEIAAACERFVRTTALLAAAAVPVPQILAVDGERGWMLVEDLGEHTLAERRDLPWTALAASFEHAVALAAHIAALPADPVRDLNPPLDQALLARELEQTRTLYLEPRAMLVPGLDAALAELCRTLAADPPVPCHRDYMARNLMPLAPGKVAVLDHQDLRLGPPAYDLASLLNDTLFPPPAVERHLLDQAFATSAAAATDRAAFDLRYHRAAAQRTLKAVGTFTAFARRGSDRHLPLVAPTLRRFVAHLGEIPEGASLVPRLAATETWAAALA